MKMTVDELAKVKAEIADLKEREKELRNSLIEFGPGKYEGTEHHVTVSEVERKTLDMKAVRGKLTRQFITANTNSTTSMTVKLFGRKAA